MKTNFKRICLIICLIGISLCFSFSATAQGGGGGGGGGHTEEGAGNNLSLPVLFAEGVGISGLVLNTLDPSSTGLRYYEPEPGYELKGPFWYAWEESEFIQVCDPSDPSASCPPDPEPPDLKRVFLQNEERNSWQAQWLDQSQSGPVEVNLIDWGDDIESHLWSTRQRQTRVEISLLKSTLSPGLTAFEMQYLSGRGSSEMWGALGTDSPNSIPQTYESDLAKIYSPCLRFTIQKIVLDSGSPDQLPIANLIWNPLLGEWDGAAYTVHKSAVWEQYGMEGPESGISAEVNVKGQMIYGFNWKIRDMILPLPVRKVGWYRLTFSLDGSALQGRACGDFILNTSMATADLVVSEEEEAESEGGLFTAIIDSENNLTYLDLYIAPGQGEDPTNHTPVCDAGSAISLPCTGYVTNVFLSGAASYDLDGDHLSYSWIHDCNNATMTGTDTVNPVLSLSDPATGITQSCMATLEVTELDLSNPLSSTCSIRIDVSACPIDCAGQPFGQTGFDQCGVCDGQNACFDCAGTPFGLLQLDRCGVCDGDGSSCLGCQHVNVAGALDGIQLRTNKQYILIRSAIKQARQLSMLRNQYKKRLLKASKLVARNNELLSELPAVMSNCVSSFCINIAQADSYQEYLRNTTRLERQLRVVLRGLSLAGHGVQANKINRRDRRIRKEIKNMIAGLPASSSNCN